MTEQNDQFSSEELQYQHAYTAQIYISCYMLVLSEISLKGKEELLKLTEREPTAADKQLRELFDNFIMAVPEPELDETPQSRFLYLFYRGMLQILIQRQKEDAQIDVASAINPIVFTMVNEMASRLTEAYSLTKKEWDEVITSNTSEPIDELLNNLEEEVNDD